MTPLKLAYFALLCIPGHYKWRLDNQDIYTRLRDAVANETGVSNEAAQTAAESAAAFFIGPWR